MKAFNYFCLKGKCFYWNSCTAKEAEQVPPEQPADVSGYQTTVARAPSKEPYKEHDGGQGAGGVGGASSPASGATSGSMTGNGSTNAGSFVGSSGQPFDFNGNQQQAFDTIYAAAVKAGSSDPRMTASVAMLESGYLGSSMTKRANNPFGQTIVASQIGKNGIVGGTVGADGQLHAVYDSVDSAVADHVRRWGSSYVANNPQQTASNLVSKGYNTVNPAWSGSVNSIYKSSNNSNNPVSVNTGTAAAVPIPKARPADLVTKPETSTTAPASKAETRSLTPGTSVNTTTAKSSTNVNVPYYNGGGGGTSFQSTPTKPIVLQNAVKTTSVPRVTSHSTTAITSTYIPGTSKAPGQVTVSTYETTPGVRSPSAFTGTQVISASSPAANQYLGRGGRAPIGADPALSRVNTGTDTRSLGSVPPGTNTTVKPSQSTLDALSSGSKGAGSLGKEVSGSTAPLDPAASGREGRTESELANPEQNQLGETPAQEASNALGQTEGMTPSSDIPAAPGGGNTGCFATGDNCDRPVDETGGAPGSTDPNANAAQTNFAANDPEGKAAAEAYLGRSMSDSEYNALVAATAAEAGTNQTEQAWVSGTILNRARSSGLTVNQVLNQKGQFEAVTGPGGNANFVRGPTASRASSINGSMTNILKNVPKNNYYFDAANPAAYRYGSMPTNRNGVPPSQIGASRFYPGANWP